MLDRAAKTTSVRRRLRLKLWLGLALLSGVSVPAQEQPASTPTTAKPEAAPTPHLEPEQLLEGARRERARLALFFRADWSPWAIAMERKVLSDPKVIEASGSRMIVAVDVGRSPDMAERFGVVDFPTLVVLDGEGAESARIRGYAGPETVASTIGPSAQGQTTSEPRGQGVEDLLARMAWLRERGRLKEAADAARQVGQLDAENATGRADNALAFLGMLESRLGRWEQAHAIYAKLTELYPTTELRSHALQSLGLAAAKLDLRQDAIRAYELFLKEFPRHPDAAFVRAEAQKLKRIPAASPGD